MEFFLFCDTVYYIFFHSQAIALLEGDKKNAIIHYLEQWIRVYVLTLIRVGFLEVRFMVVVVGR